MAEPQSQILRLLRDLREAIRAVDAKVEGVDRKLDRSHGDLKKRMDNISQALNGESILGRYAVAEVDERLEKIEKRLSALEDAD
jgi:polyhydroxyalkanoate synthesis regulator phasin